MLIRHTLYLHGLKTKKKDQSWPYLSNSFQVINQNKFLTYDFSASRIGDQPMSERVELMDNGVIMFKQAQISDQGGYQCSAENVMGIVTATASLYVEGRLVFYICH